MKILVYNNATNKMETFNRNLDDPMPYAQDRFLTVREFRGSSKSDLLWTDRRAVEAFNRLRNLFGRPIDVGYAFKRIGEGGHGLQSQHYAGVAFDIGQRMTSAERDRLRNIAINNRIFTYVEPKELTPTWVHVDKRDANPACATGGYPLVRYGSKGVYVATLQDALNTLGYDAGTIDGIFGNNTRNAVLRYQRAKGLTVDGIVGCNTWRALTTDVANNRFTIYALEYK